MSRIVVIGGSDAGVMAALRARQMDPSVEVTMMLADRYPNFSICGLPFYVSGEVEDWRALAHRTTEEIAREGVEVLVEHVATSLDAAAKEILTRDSTGRKRVLRYDTVVVATGARPRVTGIQGAMLPGVHPLHTMADSFRVRSQLDAGAVERAVIVGGGYIGLEMADALVHRGVRVTLVGRTATVIPSVDASLGAIVHSELERHGVEVATGVDVVEIGIKSTVYDGRAQFNVATFYYDYQDLQVNFLVFTLFTTDNAAEATIKGIEFETVVIPMDSLTLNANVNLLDAEFEEYQFTPTIDLAGDQLNRAPEYSANAGAQYDFSLGQSGVVSARIDWDWQDDMYLRVQNVSRHRVSDQYTVDARVQWTSSDATWLVEAFGRNLTDEDNIRGITVSDGLSTGNNTFVSYFAPRTYGVRVGYNLGAK